ncbi:TPA: hypothetical protein ACQ39K_004845 [Yersinia enterocolitica]
MSVITSRSDAFIMVKNYLIASQTEPPRELTRLRGIAEVLKYILSFGIVDAGEKRYQACLQSLVSGLRKYPTETEVFSYQRGDPNASLNFEFCVADGSGVSQRVSVKLSPNEEGEQILTVEAPDSGEASYTIALGSGADISRLLQMFLAAQLRTSANLNLNGLNLMGIPLPMDLKKETSFAGAFVDSNQVKHIVSLIQNGKLYQTALCGAVFPDNLSVCDLRFNGVLLDGKQVGCILQAAEKGYADPKALCGAKFRGANLIDIVLPDNLEGITFKDAILSDQQMLDILKTIEQGRAEETALEGFALSPQVLSHIHLYHTTALTSTEDESSTVRFGPITTFDNIVSHVNEEHRNLFNVEYNTDGGTISFLMGEDKLKTSDMADVISAITIDGKHFLENYGDILRAHHYENNPSSIAPKTPGSTPRIKAEGADELNKYCIPFYNDHPELVKFLNNCKIYKFSALSNIGDKFQVSRDSVEDLSKLAKMEYYINSMYVHLNIFNKFKDPTFIEEE